MTNGRRVLILGATSGIAQAVARVYAAEGARLALVARSREHLSAVAADLAVRGGAVVLQRAADLCEIERHRTLVAEAEQALEGLDVVLVAHGVLPDQQACQEDPRRAVTSWDVNFASAATLMEAAAERMAAAENGVLGVLPASRASGAGPTTTSTGRRRPRSPPMRAGSVTGSGAAGSRW
jgi:short-subunit dehydrogenase